MAIKNVFELHVDLKRSSNQTTMPTIVQNDSVQFIINLSDNGKPLSEEQLQEVSQVSLANVRKDRSVVVTPGTLEGSKAIFDLGTNETELGGHVKAVVQLYDSEDRVTTISFSYSVVADPTGKDYVPSEKEQTLIEVVMAEAQAKIDELSQVDVVDLKAKQDEFTVQLAQNLQQEIKFAGQADFVDLIKNKTSYKEMRVKRIQSPYDALSVFLHDGNNHVSHEWRKNKNDDYWMYHTAFAGDLTTSRDDIQSTTEKTGAWSSVDGSGNTSTTEVGATFTVHIKGERLQLNFLARDNGGVWEIVINGDTENPVIVSTYSPTMILSKAVVIADGLDPNKTHTVVGTFKGADPDNPPNGTARGWIKDIKTGADYRNYTMVGGSVSNGQYHQSQNKMLLGYASNKEFAFSITKDGQSHWFPEHNNQGTAFQLTPPKLIVDNKELDLDSMIPEEVVIGVNVQFTQKVACKFPNITDDIAILDITYSINMNGIVSVSGNIEFLQDCKINNGYTFMFPIVGEVLNEVVTGIGNSKISINEPNHHFSEEQDRVYSFCGVDERNPDYISAMSIDFPFKTLRVGKDGRGDLNSFFFFWQRDAYPKLYPHVFKDHNVVTGEKYTFNGRYCVGKVDNIYKYVK